MSERDFRRGPSDRKRAQRVAARRKAHRSRNRVPKVYTLPANAFEKVKASA